MNGFVINTLRFLFFVLFQVLVLNNLEIGGGMYPMLYPLFIMLLPFEIGAISLMIIAFVFGFTIDAFSNTFGLHASSAVVFAFFRPLVFKLLASRDGYDSVEISTMYTMGMRWFIYAFGLLLLLHHTWFFLIEVFKLNEFSLVLKKLLLSIPVSFLLAILTQVIFFRKYRAER